MKKILLLISILMLPMKVFATPLPEEPSWEYIALRYPKGITMFEAKAEGIIQPLFVYFDGYGYTP